MKADVVVDLQFGDCGKGKVTHDLLKKGKYTHCMRYNGGHNAGHTIYHEGEKVITHIIPAGVFHNVKSIIGPGCVLNVDKFFEELEELEDVVPDARKLIKIDKRVHLIEDKHLQEDSRDARIGTTKMGNGPAYRDKYARTGKRAGTEERLKEFVIDVYDEFYKAKEESMILMEGAQGFGLDIDFGDYPFVTSSNCTVSAVLQNGIPYHAIRKVYGVIKPYETYVGGKIFEPVDNEIFELIREIGKEYGATTGRPRQCNYMDVDRLVKAIEINGVTELIVNKMDVLQELSHWRAIEDGKIKKFKSEKEFKDYIDFKVYSKIQLKNVEKYPIRYSYSPEAI